ncbi:MAG: ABC transporter ATP-binding protein [Clostridia bacterium]|nr:ABC transporter ATP-binding protein [Clostridia bacterium]
MEKKLAIELIGITKAFGTKVVANKNVSMDLREGEILSVLGENGSGKTTLMNMIAGIYTPDSGKIIVRGEEVVIKSPIDAFNHHIGMIHQHFKLVDLFTAADNILLGERMPAYSVREEKKRIREAFGQKKAELESKMQEHLQSGGSSSDPACRAMRKELGKARRKTFFASHTRWLVKCGKHIQFNHLARDRVKKLQGTVDRYGFNIDLTRKIYDMSVSEKQTVEIIKVLYRGADILILDEPTAVLTPQEIEKLFSVLRKMRDEGKSIIIITHKLNEVMAISDRVCVLRKGEHIATVETAQTNEKELTDMMVGQKIDLNIKRDLPKDPRPRLQIRDMSVVNKEGRTVVNRVSFDICGGEILGIAGISGNGQKELLEGIAGLQQKSEGDIIFHNPKKDRPVTFYHKDLKQIKAMAAEGFFHYPNGDRVDLTNRNNKEIVRLVNEEQILFYEDEIIDLKDRTPREIQELGIKLSFVPEDRLNMGLVGSMSIVDNMMLRSYRKGNSIFVNRKRPKKLADEIIHDLEVVTPSDLVPVRRLSGGNVQKVLVGREISSSPKVLMVAYPVRGLDINSSYTIYNLLNDQKDRNVAVVYVGEDLDVLLALCDRILVLCGGHVSGIVDARKVTKKELGLMMTTVPDKVETYQYEDLKREETDNGQ